MEAVLLAACCVGASAPSAACTYDTEPDCGRDPDCYLDAGVCKVEPCGEHTGASECDADGWCMLDSGSACVRKNCNAMGKCACLDDAKCYWKLPVGGGGGGSCMNKDYGLCPLMDLVLLVDGSGSMQQSFSGHPHGYYGLVEILRSWVVTLPLTGEGHAGGAQSATFTGLRVGVIQFSGPSPNEARKSPAGVGSEGSLTGDVSELQADIDWHETNYIGLGTYLSEALSWAGAMFNDSPSQRKKVLIIFSDGMVSDTTSLNTPMSVLDMQGVEFFGVVVRRFPTHTQVDTDAEATLKPITSAPRDDHFYNLLLDEVPDTLGELCNPNGMWGRYIVDAPQAGEHKPCQSYVTSQTCTGDVACTWSGALGECTGSVCVGHCSAQSCRADTAALCTWDAVSEMCFRVGVCSYSDEATCSSDPMCAWVGQQCAERQCYYTDETSCIADTAVICVWSASGQTCSERPCQYTSSVDCNSDATCMWNAACSEEKCVSKPCTHTEEEVCEGDAMCDWSLGLCNVAICAEYSDERCCSRGSEGCYWDVQQAPAVCAQLPCRKIDARDVCDSERACMWNSTSGTCTEKLCSETWRCGCESDPDCFFVEGPQHCTFQRYGLCPTLDMVVLLDGGVSMSKSFGRHPQGFYAVVEVVKEWASTLPLSRSAAGVPGPNDRGSRIAFVQFAGTGVWPIADQRQILVPSGAGTSRGRFTGVMKEIEGDLSYFESNFMGGSSSLQPAPQKTYLLAGLEEAVSLFKTSLVDGSKRVLIIISDGPLDDKSKYQASLAALDQAQVAVFGAAVRRSTALSTDDIAASADMREVVSDPKDEHMVSVEVDQLGAALGGLCDPNTEWGQFIADSTQQARGPCVLYSGRIACDADVGCVWFDSSLSCGVTPCLAHCDEHDCLSDAENMCRWNGASCEKTRVCQSGLPKDFCRLGGCEYADGACKQRQCAHSNEQGCLADADACSWSSIDLTCALSPPKQCDWGSQDQCNLQGGCVWKSLVSQCTPKTCLYADQAACESAEPGLCRWANSVCTTTPCRQHGSEYECQHYPECDWATVCELAYCERYADEASACDADGLCMHNAADDKCVTKECGALDSCRCHKDSDCFWDKGVCKAARFGECPTLDIVLAVGGSASMSQVFKRHPHGYYGLIGLLQAWTAQLPLSGEHASQGSPRPTGMTRVGVVQFSGNPANTIPGTDLVDGARKTPAGVGSGGHLTGNKAELAVDLEWQASNFMGGGTYMAAALDMAADMFKASPAEGRKKVLIIFTDGQIQDADKLVDARGRLEDVVTFGVVVRRFPTHTQVDTDAEATLKPITSAPRDDHFCNLLLDEVPDTLGELCNPNGMWGKYIVDAPQAGEHRPCGNYGEKSACNADTGCVFSDGLVACVATPCIRHCEEMLCSADVRNGCYWEAGDSACYEEPGCSHYPAEAPCANDDGCAWREGMCVDKPCGYPDENSCTADSVYVCIWSSSGQSCGEKPCQYTEQAACAGDAACLWDMACVGTGVAAVCIPMPCAYATEMACGADAMCSWAGGTCSVNECAPYMGERCCNAHEVSMGCRWDVKRSPALCSVGSCRRVSDESACKSERACMWDSSMAVCVEKNCNKVAGRCACDADPDCFYVSGAAPHCTFQRYGLCPTMDVVLLLDGGVSMARTFGRHPQGFYAVVEVVRDWARTLPLSGSVAGAAQIEGANTARLAIVQFAGSGVWAAGDSRQALSPSGAGTSEGRFTGSLREVDADLSFQEKNFMGGSSALQPAPQKTYLLAGLERAVSLFRTSLVDGRRRVLIIISDGPLDDKSQYQTARAELDQAQVAVFGIVIRRFDTHTALDEKAQEALQPLVSDPKDEHIANVQVDKVAVYLNGLCDPSQPWGKYIGVVTEGRAPCQLYTDGVVCDNDPGCVWFDSTLLCTSSPCLEHCDQSVCLADVEGCEWDVAAASCEKRTVCRYPTVAICEQDAGCQWKGAACIRKECKHGSEQGCLADLAVCVWDSIAQGCSKKQCMYDDSSGCGLDPSCEWDVAAVVCRLKICSFSDRAACEADDMCEWDNSACATSPCRQYSDEKLCAADDDCEWSTDVAPGACGVKYCRGQYCYDGMCPSTNADECNLDSSCIYSEAGMCDSMACGLLVGQCACHRVVGCFWLAGENACVDQRYAACSTLDLVVVFDGSASMTQTFGRHPHGFYGMVEMLRSWVAGLPLSGELAGAVPTTTAASRRMRVAFVQFSGEAMSLTRTPVPRSAVKTPGGVGTMGRLSGDLKELSDDLDWHATNFMGKGAYVSLGLQMAASVLQESPVDGRKRAVCIITSRQLQDQAYLEDARAKMGTVGAQVFGIVVRRFESHTQVDTDAEEALKPITSAPHDTHFVNVNMDQLVSESGPLMQLCDPATDFGLSLATGVAEGEHQPCIIYASKTTCMKDVGCVWNDLSCVTSPCVMHCDEASCDNDVVNKCVGGWDPAGVTCYRKEECSSDNQPSCEAEGCVWNATSSECVERPCSHGTEDGCLAETEFVCRWEVSTQECAVSSGSSVQCSPHPDEATCKADVLCQWDSTSASCEARPCVGYADERLCNADLKCHWDTAIAPGSCQLLPCARYESEATCGLDTECRWEAAGPCVRKTCHTILARCECQQDTACFWSGGGSRCEQEVYARCPTLDAVLVLDGSGSMSLSFGRHPHGFYAMMEMVRDWVKTLPLSGELSSVGIGSASTGGVRLGIVQFSGSSNSVDPATGAVVGSALKTPVGTGSGGRLSGDLTQLQQDVTWHEDNYMSQMTYIEEGLNMAASMLLNDSPLDGRQRVVMIITDGVLMDGDRLTGVKAKLQQLQVITFGIAVRRFSSATSSDDATAAALRPVVTEQAADHFLSLTMDEIPVEVLTGLCDPSNKWGKAVVPASGGPTPCVQLVSENECNLDSGCQWSDTTLSCATAPCYTHCAESACTADVVSQCAWNATSGDCERMTLCGYVTAASCFGDAECVWEVDKCVGKPCSHSGEGPCLLDPEGCVWDSAQNECTMMSCEKQTSEVGCSSLAETCMWDTGSSVCRPKRCVSCETGNQTCCEALENKLWCDFKGDGSCVEKPCVQYVDGLTCGDEWECEWDVTVSPGMCREKYCARFSDSQCELEVECLWDFGSCNKRKCQDYMWPSASEAECAAGTGCFWYEDGCTDVHYGACPTMDIVVLLDGSASMSQPFGRHPSGYQALIEMLKDWVYHLSLPGDVGAAGRDPTLYPEGSARVALIQFSGDGSMAGPSGVPGSALVSTDGAKGRLSGYSPQLRQDLSYHAHNQMAKDTYIGEALGMAVGLLSGPSYPSDGRRKIVLVLLGGPLDDATQLSGVVTQVESVGAHLFGVVVRRAGVHLTHDMDAEASLKPLVSKPQEEHFVNVEIDKLGSEVFEKWCDPSSPWGGWMLQPGVTLPCLYYTSSADCSRDAMCAWDDGLVACTVSPCLQFTSSLQCKEADPAYLCEYSTNDSCKKERTCAHSDEAACLGAAECRWVSAPGGCELAPCQHYTEEACVADASGCGWKDTEGCAERQCVSPVSAVCIADPRCTWDQAEGTCCEVVCQTTEETACTKDPRCFWSYYCEARRCAEHPGERSCVADQGCEWEVATSPAYCKETHCSRWTVQTDCEPDATCAWEGSVCVPSMCSMSNGMPCSCAADPSCFWVESRTACVEAAYGACPPMDIVVVFDGSADMGYAFGRHPHGFDALVEMLKDWVRGLPLSGDSYTVPAATAQVAGMRVAFVQMGPDVNPILVTTPMNPATSAAGFLSGQVDQLLGDLAFHSANMLGGSGRFLEAALDHAQYVFASQSPTTRKQVLIVLTGGLVGDEDKVAGSLKKMSPTLQVFGVMLRRLEKRSPADRAAEGQMSTFVPVAHDEHFMGLEVDELKGKVLTALCDPTKTFGRPLAGGVGANMPCAMNGFSECSADTGCAWSEALLQCTVHPCRVYGCDETGCTADTTCQWDGTSCFKKPLACPGQSTQTGCDAVTESGGCVWGTYGCVAKPCVGHKSEDSCVADPGLCEWSSNDETCMKIGCTYPTEQECAAAASEGCAWDVDHCKTVLCTAVDEATCVADGACEWGMACTFKKCRQHDTEAECDHDSECHWDVGEAPSKCDVKVCSRYASEGACETDPELRCSWDSGSGNCVDKSCTKITTSCDCNKDLGCFWDAGVGSGVCVTRAFGGCPLMDVVILLDGTSSMKRPFGRHASGYEAVVEYVRDWAKKLPLTGDSGSIISTQSVASGVRVGVVQFGAQGWEKKMGPGFGTGGHVTGLMSELDADLDFHETKMLDTEEAYVAGALGLARSMLTRADRKRVVLVVSDSVLQDAGGVEVSEAVGSLVGLGVGVFGVLLRPAASFPSTAGDARNAMLSVLGNMQHFQDAQMEGLKDILWALCDPSEQFGALITSAQGSGSAVSRPCPMHVGKDACNKDTACWWSPTLLVCSDSECVRHCERDVCIADDSNLCMWGNNGVCSRRAVCDHPILEECLADPGCEWNANQACVEKPCQHLWEVGCVSDSVGCVWESTLRRCSLRLCAHTTQQACLQDISCLWDAALVSVQGWMPCVERPCMVTEPDECLADSRHCQWIGDSCYPRPCAKYLDEMACNHDAECHWDVRESPSVCGERYCKRAEEEATCSGDPKCTWSSSHSLCEEVVCGDLTTQCACSGEELCLWDGVSARCKDKAFSGCPSMDLAVVFDGSESMGQAFGRHPYGFYALVEALRDWVAHLPLAGEAPVIDASGVRIGLVQFSTLAGAQITPPGTGTGGRFSGSLAELQADFDWHGANYAMGQVYLLGALEYVGAMFQSVAVSGRTKIMLIITSGVIQDVRQLGEARASLVGQGVETFGVVIRRFATHTQTDMDAEQILATAVSEPRDDHYMSIPLDDFSDNVLMDFCSPNSKFGNIVSYQGQAGALPCSSFREASACWGQRSCAWDDVTIACGTRLCSTHCEQAVCEAGFDEFGPCAWRGGSCGGYQGRCVYTTRPECQSGECFWDSDMCVVPPCFATAEDGCIADPHGCGWDDVTSICMPRKCYDPEQPSCNAKPYCSWDTKVAQCVEKPCIFYTAQGECEKHSFDCKWEGAACVPVNGCIMYSNEEDCGADPGGDCAWHTEHSPAHCNMKRCRMYSTEASCRAEDEGARDGCGWDVAAAKCDTGVLLCSGVAQPCGCAQVEGCTWDAYTQRCTASLHANCPAVDLVAVVDGSVSMGERFGRHPHGFFAVAEMLLDLAKTLPLTGEAAGVATDSSLTSGFRMGMVQYSAQGSALKAPKGTGTEGRLSGVFTEIDADVHWHEGQFAAHATPDSYLTQALEMAAGMFSASPAGRKKVLLAVASGRILDVDSLSLVRVSGLLEQQRVQVFGLYTRRFTSPTTDDENSREQLKAFASSPSAMHTQGVTVTELGGVLTGLCNANTTFGYFISEHGVPAHKGSCSEWAVPSGCMTDSMCTWSDIKGECVASQCILHCSATTCAGDTTGECLWNGVACMRGVCTHSEETECNSSPGCEWAGNTTVCKPSVGCSAMLTYEQCTTSGNCAWDAAGEVCREVQGCFVQTTLTACGAEVGCKWNTATGVCQDVVGCLAYEGAAMCTGDCSCTWGASSVCVDRNCAFYGTQAECAAPDAAMACVWDAARGLCKGLGSGAEWCSVPSPLPAQPTLVPTSAPATNPPPTDAPLATPQPTAVPSAYPATPLPGGAPTPQPLPASTPQPTAAPTPLPVGVLTPQPTAAPAAFTPLPSGAMTLQPTATPIATPLPGEAMTVSPAVTLIPIGVITAQPTAPVATPLPSGVLTPRPTTPATPLPSGPMTPQPTVPASTPLPSGAVTPQPAATPLPSGVFTPQPTALAATPLPSGAVTQEPDATPLPSGIPAESGCAGHDSKVRCEGGVGDEGVPCVWTGGVCEEAAGCALYQDGKVCLGAPAAEQCDWFAVSDLGGGAVAVCREGCTAKKTEDECGQQAGCGWGEDSCVKLGCAVHVEEVSCSADECQWDGARCVAAATSQPEVSPDEVVPDDGSSEDDGGAAPSGGSAVVYILVAVGGVAVGLCAALVGVAVMRRRQKRQPPVLGIGFEEVFILEGEDEELPAM